MAGVVLVSARRELRETMLEPLARAGRPARIAGTWDGLVAALVDPRSRLVLVDAELPGLRPELVHELLRSLEHPPELRVLGVAPPLTSLPRQRVPILLSRHGRQGLSTQERRELRLLGLGRNTLTILTEVASSRLPVLIVAEMGSGKQRLAEQIHRLGELTGPFLVVPDPRELPPLEGPPGLLYLDRAELLGADKLEQLAARLADTGWRLVAGSRRRRPRELNRWHRLQLPPLRTRQDELRKLTLLYTERACRSLGLPKRRFDRATWALIRAYRWPENARELESFTVQAVAGSSESTVRAARMSPRVRALLEPKPDNVLLDQSEGFEDMVEARARPMVEAVRPDSGVHLHRLVIDATERALLRLVLAQTGGNQKAAAQMLGLARNTLRAKAIRLQLIRTRGREQ